MDETKFLFESKFKLEDSFPDSKTSNESIDAQGSDNIDTKDDLDPFMFCSPRYFVFNEGTSDLMIKDLLGHVKITTEYLKEAAKGAPRTILGRVRLDLC